MEDAAVRCNIEDLTQGILDIYDVDEETVKEDIREFLDTLEKGGVQ